MKTIPLDAVPVLAQTVGEMLASIGRLDVLDRFALVVVRELKLRRRKGVRFTLDYWQWFVVDAPWSGTDQPFVFPNDGPGTYYVDATEIEAGARFPVPARVVHLALDGRPVDFHTIGSIPARPVAQA